MMGGVQPPSIGGIIGSHDARLSRAERRADSLEQRVTSLEGTVVHDSILFTGGPGLAVATSGLDHAKISGTLFSVTLGLSATPVATTTVRWLVNGTALVPTGAGSADMVIGTSSPTRGGLPYARYDFIARIAGSYDPLNADMHQIQLTTVDTVATQVLTVKGFVT